VSTFNKYAPSGMINDLPSFWAAMANAPQAKLQPLPSDRARLVTRLTDMEVATIRCVVPKLSEVPPGFSRLSRAAAFLAAWEGRGQLKYMSGYYLARELTGAMFTLHPFRGHRRGLEVLADLDGANLGVEVWCSTLRPDPPGLDRYERVRLSERLREIAAVI
jgi:hypothetical protein